MKSKVLLVSALFALAALSSGTAAQESELAVTPGGAPPSSSASSSTLDDAAQRSASPGGGSQRGKDELAPGVPLIFEPEDEWKEILPGQQLPGGLDIRMDLGQGGKWAKKPAGYNDGRSRWAGQKPGGAASAALVIAAETGEVLGSSAPGEGGDATSPASKDSTEDGGAIGGTDEDAFTVPAGLPQDLDEQHARMATVLLSLPQPEPELVDVLVSGQAGRMDRGSLTALLQKVWNKRQAELKDAFAKAKTEAQQMQGLLSRLLDPAAGAPAPAAEEGGEPGSPIAGPLTVGEQIATLEDLEFFVSAVHNAEDFASMGGLTAMALLTNSSDSRVASHAAWVIGTAVKNAPEVQAAAMTQGALYALLNLLFTLLEQLRGRHVHAGMDSVDASALTSVAMTTDSLKTLSKAVYGVGGMLRYHPVGQVAFVESSGQVVLGQIMEGVSGVLGQWSHPSSGEDRHAAAQQALGTLAKILNLVEDLLSHAEVEGGEAPPVDRLTLRKAGAGGGGGASGKPNNATPAPDAGAVEAVPLPGTKRKSNVPGYNADGSATVPETDQDGEPLPASVRRLMADRGGFMFLCDAVSKVHMTLGHVQAAVEGAPAGRAVIDKEHALRTMHTATNTQRLCVKFNMGAGMAGQGEESGGASPF